MPYLFSALFFSVLFLLPAATQPLKAQNKALTDSLERLLLRQSASEKKTEILLQLSQIYTATNTQKSFEYATQALDIAQKQNLPLFTAMAFNALGNINLQTGKYPKALQYYQKALNIAQKNQLPQIQTQTLRNIGNAYYLQGEYPKAEKYYKQTLALSKKQQDKQKQAAATNNLAALEFQWGNYDKAIEYYRQALATFSKTGDQAGVATSIQNIGAVYYQWEKFDMALQTYNKALKRFRKIDRKENILSCITSIGSIYMKKQQFDSAQIMLSKAMQISREINSIETTALLYLTIAQNHAAQKKHQQATQAFTKALEINQQLGAKEGIATAAALMAQNFLAQQKYQQAKEFADKSQKIAFRLGLKETIMQNYEIYFEYYILTNNPRQALLFHKKYKNLRDSVFNSQKHRQIAELTAKYHFRQQQQAIKLLKTDKALQQQQLKRTNTIRKISFAALIIVSLFAAFFFYQLREKNKAHKKISREVKQRQKVEKALKQSEERFELAVWGANDAIWDWNIKTDYVFYSPRWAEMLQYQPHELEANIHSFFNLLDEKQILTLTSELHAYLEGKSPTFEQTVLVKNKNKTPLWILVRAQALRNKKGQAYRMVGTFTDITKQKETEAELQEHKNHLAELVEKRTHDLEIAKQKAEESDHLKSEFLANISHEIRTPLNAIVGFSDMIKSGDTDPTQLSDYLDLIQISSYNLLHLINNIVEYSRLSTEKINPEKQQVFPEKILTDLHSNFIVEKNNTGKQRLAFMLNLPDEKEQQKTEFHLFSDSNRIYQILENLVDNALKFTEKGFVEIGYRLKNNKQICFFVKDSGVGIAPEQQEIIFDQFVKIVQGQRIQAGTGLGLAIARKLALLLGGTLTLESAPGKGATFRLILPIESQK